MSFLSTEHRERALFQPKGAFLAHEFFHATKIGEHFHPNGRSIDGALLDLEYQRIEPIKITLLDQSTYPEYVAGRDGVPSPVLSQWDWIRPAPAARTRQLRGGRRQESPDLPERAHSLSDALRHRQRTRQPAGKLEPG